ncbi:MAG: hypothetical protein Q9210_006588 [Variospora velana]
MKAGSTKSDNNALILLATLISLAICHPLNLLHSHHHHHAHHHLHLRLPSFRSEAAKSAPQLQQPISSGNPNIDTSNVFINMTIKASITSVPASFLIPLRASTSPQQVEFASSVFQHPRTAKISHIQHGTGPADQSRRFQRAGDVACYPHTQATLSEKRRSDAVGKKAPQEKKSKLEPFRLVDGEVDFTEAADGRWSAPEGSISGLECVLDP